MRRSLLMTGADGFLARNALPVLENLYDLTAISRKDCDLLDQRSVRRLLQEIRPEVVVHLAGRVGGIAANRDYPADFCYENLLMNTMVIHESSRAGARKFVAFVGGCAYPADAPNPIPETALWLGYPQAESAPFSTAMRMMHVQTSAYHAQFGLSAALSIPGNVYGPFDNFSADGGHVVPGMIRRFHDAVLSSASSVTCWGSGNPTRDFLYAGDLVACLPFLIDQYDGPEPLNIARGESTTIRQLAEITAAVAGYRGEIEWDTSRPDGQQEKVLDTSHMRQLGLSCPTSIEEGVRRTYNWFVAHRDKGARV